LFPIEDLPFRRKQTPRQAAGRVETRCGWCSMTDWRKLRCA